ncbi:MAG TPA: (2Fe-2S)-binding protein [Polyangia bacterium]
MIVCVCHGVCEKRLEAVIEAGAHTPEQVERQCGAGGDCGACRPDVERLIERITLGAPNLGRPGSAIPTPALGTRIPFARSDF